MIVLEGWNSFFFRHFDYKWFIIDRVSRKRNFGYFSIMTISVICHFLSINNRKKISAISQMCSRISWILFPKFHWFVNSRISPATTFVFISSTKETDTERFTDLGKLNFLMVV